MANAERRPAQGPSAEQTAAKRSSAMVADGSDIAGDLRRILATDRPTYEQGWRDGYQRGFDAGWNVGYGRASIEHNESWERLAKKIIRSSSLSFTDLRRLRNMPTGEAWEQWQRRHGDYRGGPVDFDTGEPVAPAGGRRG